MSKKRPTCADDDQTATIALAPVRVMVPPESGRRISYERGGLFWFRDQPVQIEEPHPTGSGFVVKRLRTGDTATAQFHELEPLPVGVDPTANATVIAAVDEVSAAEWERARAVETAICALLAKDSFTRQEEYDAAQTVGLSWHQLRKLRGRYQRNPTLSVLVRSRPGRREGVTRLLPDAVRDLMDEVICRELILSPDIAVDVVLPLIRLACRMAGLKAPGRTTTAQRLRELRARPANLPHGIGAEISYAQAPVLGSLETRGALEVVQIDHTVCDVIIVDCEQRKPIGRPVLTLAIDAHTRVVLGMLLSLEAPSSLSVGLCLQHAVFPKDHWLQELGVATGTWPGFGVPKALHVDNAKEFHAQALERGCHRYRIELIYRPIGDPKVGGTIERVIGTFMGRVRLIPGATFCKVLRGRPRRAERLARFTLPELYQYLAGEVAQYHLRPHRSLDTSPKLAWERAWKINSRRCYPELPEHSAAFLVQFLPLARRTVSREGIFLFGLRYQASVLHDLVHPGLKRTVRYDPRNLSVIYVECDDVKSHLVVPLGQQTLPAFSIWEWREIRKRRLVPLYPGDASLVEAALVQNRQMIQQGSSARRSLRKGRRAQRERHWRATAPVIASPPPPEPDPLKIISRSEEGTLTCDVLE